MQPIDALTLHHLAGELDLKLADGKINKIQQASHHELLLHLWVGGEVGRQKLYINIRPEYAFCALIEDSSFLNFPEQAPNFCMVLRKHLLSARIQRVETLPDERVLNIRMDNYNELGQHVQLVLSLELMGKNSNIILYDEELKMIIGCAHGVSEEMSRQREVSVGYPYVPPPRPAKVPIRFANRCEVTDYMESAWATHHDSAETLTKAYSGIGRATLGDLFTYHTDADEAYDAMMALFQGVHLYPAIKRDYSRYSLLPQHQTETDWMPIHSINAMIREFYLRHLLEDRLKARKQQFRQVLKAQEKKLQKRRQELEKSQPDVIEMLRKSGDLLTIAHSQGIHPTGNKIEMTDYATGEPIAIEIDPTLSLGENAQVYYRRYKKAQSRQAVADQTAHQLETTLAFLQELYSAVDLAMSQSDLDSIREDLEAQGWMKPLESKRKGNRKLQSEPLSVVSSDGLTILVGKNGLQNDQLAGKLSRPDDLWLHVHLIPGSHVLIRAEKQEVPDRSLEEAATLAAYFSKARGSVNVPVVYTKAQYVRKIPNSYPGHVNYTHEKAINVTPDETVVQKLLQKKPLPV